MQQLHRLPRHRRGAQGGCKVKDQLMGFKSEAVVTGVGVELS